MMKAQHTNPETVLGVCHNCYRVVAGIINPYFSDLWSFKGMYIILGKTRFPEPITILTHQSIGWHGCLTLLTDRPFFHAEHTVPAHCAGILILAFKIE
jgi:hypothetical protein